MNFTDPNTINNLNGWNMVISWKRENFELNHDQIGYLTNMYASEIFPRLYVGSTLAASDRAWLMDHNITHILSVTDHPPQQFLESYKYKTIPIRDNDSTNIMEHFDTTYEFIYHALKENGNVLVHCQRGISRSATIAIAYIMKNSQIVSAAAYHFVKSKRPIICYMNQWVVKLLKQTQNIGVIWLEDGVDPFSCTV
ncbi:protein-tyrosine phosphatase-like protein [Gigaspora rosea]|uniref:protein-tyrosine-phosphatase n=1 Tax=Gigaspora rosea TaxID=44941 RepID=A0A397W7E0_9GLOM|nr:protein-tyrosine phosphatase-like protein [Gigaspora rosea]